MRTVLIASVTALLTGASLAGTVHVDATNPNCPGSGSQTDPFCSIQAGIQAAILGDTVLVAPGVYVETLDFLGKAITVESVAGPSTTIIDANFVGSCVTFASNEGRQSVLRGFRLIHGGGTITVGPLGQNVRAGLGVFIQSASPVLDDNEIDGHAPISPPTESLGAAIYAQGGSPAIVGNVISKNVATSGGGLYATACSNLSIEANYFRSNEGVSTGAAIELRDCQSATVVGNDFERNGEQGMFGPPLSSSASLYLLRCNDVDFRGNEIWDSFVEDEGILSMEECSGEVRDNVIRNCGAGNVGGFLLRNCTDLLFVDDVIRDNTAGVVAGGQIVGGSGVVLLGTRFAANLSVGIVDGLQISSAQPVAVKRCIFEQHSNPFASGIALRLSSGPAIVEDCVFNSNKVGVIAMTGSQIRRSTFWNNSGAAVIVEASPLTIVPIESSILYQNGWPSGAEIFVASGLVQVSDSFVYGGYPGTHVINGDPLFTNAGAGDFRLQPGSPCIESGSPGDGACGLDARGAPRRVAGAFGLTARVDMGAYEFSQVDLHVDKLAGINTFQLTSSGAAGQPTLLLASVGRAEVCAAPAGTLLIDLAAPSIVISWAALPSQIQVTVPPIALAELHLQQLVLGPTPGTGNLSAVATLVFD